MEPKSVKVTIEPEPVKVTIEPEKDNKPDLNNDGNKQSSRLSSSSLDLAIDEKDFLSPHPWSMISASPPPDFGPHLLPDLSTDIYDPNRIPASVFSTKPDGWSVASNESLFSIQMGNNSFSHDNAILYEKSGELGRLDDWNPIGSQLSVHGNVSEPKKGHNNNCELSGGLKTVNEESSLTSGEVSRVDSFDSPRLEPYRLVKMSTCPFQVTLKKLWTATPLPFLLALKRQIQLKWKILTLSALCMLKTDPYLFREKPVSPIIRKMKPFYVKRR
ncbi:hypothetical protein CASFOL_011285 [Castilleja foliolosa]|uniref:Uncharacterized protein n=1 Tax=Castilleja foliolosa TaxID=1961234 RepID=A0ABD3DWU3_9LAMI